jgi:hypothetical protein
MKESEIQRELLSLARNHPNVSWMDRANSGKVRVKGSFMQLHAKGTPDIIGFTVSGRFIGIELKRPDTKNNTNNDQKVMQELMRISNCVYGIAYDKESLNKILDTI